MAPRTSDITFCSIDEDDLEWARELHNDPEVLSMLTDSHIITQEEQVAWFKKLKGNKTSERWVVWLDDERVGLVRLDQIDRDNENICIGLDIHKDYRGQHLAKLIYYELMTYWFQQGMTRIWLQVSDYNVRARKLYIELGFKEEGRLRLALKKNGQYYDYILMSILKEEYTQTGWAI